MLEPALPKASTGASGEGARKTLYGEVQRVGLRDDRAGTRRRPNEPGGARRGTLLLDGATRRGGSTPITRPSEHYRPAARTFPAQARGTIPGGRGARQRYSSSAPRAATLGHSTNTAAGPGLGDAAFGGECSVGAFAAEGRGAPTGPVVSDLSPRSGPMRNAGRGTVFDESAIVSRQLKFLHDIDKSATHNGKPCRLKVNIALGAGAGVSILSGNREKRLPDRVSENCGAFKEIPHSIFDRAMGRFGRPVGHRLQQDGKASKLWLMIKRARFLAGHAPNRTCFHST